jgi:P27 family predicted phage terminase small subunit
MIDKAPAHLQADTKLWWESVVRDYVLDAHHKKLLTVAAESWDRAREARLALKKYGLTFTTVKGELKPRPETAIERHAKVIFMRALRELGLDSAAAPESPRPPLLPGNMRTKTLAKVNGHAS